MSHWEIPTERESCPPGRSQQGKTRQKAWPSARAPFLPSCSPVGCPGTPPQASLISPCYLITRNSLLSFISNCLKTGFCRNCSKGSYPLFSTSRLPQYHQYKYLPFPHMLPSITPPTPCPTLTACSLSPGHSAYPFCPKWRKQPGSSALFFSFHIPV